MLAVLLMITVYWMRSCDSAACGEGSCDKGDGCELHSRIQRPALDTGMSGRCNTHLYSSEATLSYRYPACKYLIPFFQSRFQHLAFHVLPSSSYVINNHCLNSARSTLKLVPISNPFHLFELCRNIPKGEIRGGIHRKFPSCFALVTCLADYLDDPNILLPDDYVLCIAPLFTVLRVPMCTKTYHFLQVQ